MGYKQNGFAVLILTLLTATFFGSDFANAQDWDLLGSDEPDDRLIFSINSLSSLQNNPPNPSEFSLEKDTRITLIRTFHWNNGAGDASGQSGWIKIIDATNQEFKLPVRYLERRGDVQNAYWVACGEHGFQGSGDIRGDLPPLLNIRLGKGKYRIVDSGQATWSHNRATGGMGMFFIYGM